MARLSENRLSNRSDFSRIHTNARQKPSVHRDKGQKKNGRKKGIVSSAFYQAKDPLGFGPQGFSKHWLAAQEAYSLHKQIRKNFPRNPIHVTRIGEMYEADLVDLTSISKVNDGFKFLLNVIDVFSKQAWSIPLRNKSGKEVARGLDSIFVHQSPQYLRSDRGKEFQNRDVAQEEEFWDVAPIFTNDPRTKASVVERFNRTLKTRMFKYFTANSSYRWVEVLPQLLHSYNHRYHRSIKMAPREVNRKNEKQVYFNLFGKRPAPRPFRLAVGDTVRITKEKNPFDKSYEQGWTEERFVISRRVPGIYPSYVLKDYRGEELQGRFYEPEVQKVPESDVFNVERVIRTKKLPGGKTAYLVKWKGFDESHNSWVTDLWKK